MVVIYDMASLRLLRLFLLGEMHQSARSDAPVTFVLSGSLCSRPPRIKAGAGAGVDIRDPALTAAGLHSSL